MPQQLPARKIPRIYGFLSRTVLRGQVRLTLAFGGFYGSAPSRTRTENLLIKSLERGFSGTTPPDAEAL